MWGEGVEPSTQRLGLHSLPSLSERSHLRFPGAGSFLELTLLLRSQLLELGPGVIPTPEDAGSILINGHGHGCSSDREN